METEPLRIFQKIHLDTIFLSALSDETKFLRGFCQTSLLHYV